MRLNCGKSRLQRRREHIYATEVWHKWFAWLPIRVKPEECVWLEHVERKISYWYGESYHTEYREMKDAQ